MRPQEGRPIARKYATAPKVTPGAVETARKAADDAAAALAALEHGDPSAEDWAARYAAARAAHAAAARRAELTESARAAQVERAGQRAETVKNARADLEKMTAELTASRDKAAAAAAGHLRALAILATACDAHNRLVADCRAALASLGLMASDETLDGAVRHGEGAHGGAFGTGLRAGNVDWTPVPAAGVVGHALHQVLPEHDLRGIGTRWMAGEVTGRPDQLHVPSLEDVGATVPAPEPAIWPRRATIETPDLIRQGRIT